MAQTIAHAPTLGIPFSVRVIAQVSNKKRKVSVLETIDATYTKEQLNPDVLSQAWKAREYLAKHRSEFMARAFMSSLEDKIRQGVEVVMEELCLQEAHQLSNQQKSDLEKLLAPLGGNHVD
jgi:hypothetical protein